MSWGGYGVWRHLTFWGSFFHIFGLHSQRLHARVFGNRLFFYPYRLRRIMQKMTKNSKWNKKGRLIPVNYNLHGFPQFEVKLTLELLIAKRSVEDTERRFECTLHD